MSTTTDEKPDVTTTDKKPDADIAATEEKEEESPPIYPYGEPGPTQDEIDALKEKYVDIELITLAGKVWIYRQMGRKEHLELIEKGLMDLDSDGLVVQTLLIWPDPKTIDWDRHAAGVVPTLSSGMLVFSGFVPTAAPIKL